MGKRVLVTGIKGFTGRYMATELERYGYEVTGVGSSTGGETGYHQIDLNDGNGLLALLKDEQPDVVIHLAAVAFVGHGTPDEFYKVNLIGTRNLLQAVSDCGKRPECVLLASSANIYGNASAGLLDEDTPPSPANDYAVSKLAMEYMANLWKEKLPIVVARPFNYTGVGQANNFLVPKIVDHFQRRADTIELGNLDISRDFSDVRNVVQLYRRLVEHPESVGRTVNVSSGTTHSLREVVFICEELTGHKIRIEVNPIFVRANEVSVLYGDNSRLRDMLGEIDIIPLRDTLEWMLASVQPATSTAPL